MILESYGRTQQLCSRFFLTTVSLVCGVGFFACASQGMDLTGTWVSTEISHPSPFFAETLSHDTHKSLTLFFYRTGEFTWRNREDGCLAGTYFIQNGTLILTKSHGEAITLEYAVLGDRLLLRSRDDFKFDFQKTSEGNPVVTKPCKS